VNDEQNDDLLSDDLIPYNRRPFHIPAGPGDEEDGSDDDGSDAAPVNPEIAEERSKLRFERRFVGEHTLFGIFRGYRVYLDRFETPKYVM